MLMLDREALIRDSDKQRNQKRGDRVPLVTTYHPALSSMMMVVQKLHPMLKSTEEHRKVFPEPPFISFRRCKILKDILVRSKLYNVDNGARASQLYQARISSLSLEFANDGKMNENSMKCSLSNPARTIV